MSKLSTLLRTIDFIQEGVLDADPRMLECSVEYLATICNGCGAADAKIDLVPDSVWGLYIGYACMIHDFDYHMGTTEADRRFADERFKKSLLILIAAASKALWPARRIRVNSYYKIVRACGEAPFWNAKAYNIVTLGVTFKETPDASGIN